MKRQNIPLMTLLVTIFFSSTLGAQNLIINEFMFAPNSGEAEWIELWNRSGHVVSLRGWSLMDATRTPVQITGSDITIEPGKYVLLASAEPIADRWRQLACAVIVIPGFPALNNTGDEIVICDRSGVVIDSLRYESSWNPKKSATAERRRPTLPFTRENCGAALHPDGGTPGQRNSQTPHDFDLSILSMVKTSNGVTVTVKNEGLEILSTAGVLCGCDADGDGVIGSVDPSLTVVFLPPLPDAEIPVDVLLSCADAPILRALLIAPQDTNPLNDTLVSHSVVPIGSGDLLFNEIMAAPLSGKAEWVELFNRSGRAVSPAACSLAVATSSNGSRTTFELPSDLPRIPPRGYLLIASDSSVYTDWPYLSSQPDCVVAVLRRSSLGLGNNGGELLFVDAAGGVTDSLVYSGNWHHPFVASTTGRSLELLHPDLRAQDAAGWTSSPDPSGGTPGKRNGAYSDPGSPHGAPEEHLSFRPNPFSPDGDGFEDNCVISWKLPAAVSLLRLRVFDVEGRCIRTLLNSVPAGREGMTVWNGLDDSGRRVRIGMYLVLAEALDASSNSIAAAKAVVAVATRL